MSNLTTYRKCVGITVFNSRGKIWVGKRSDIIKGQKSWQMPQGGINIGEKPLTASKRELLEETGIKTVKLIKESSQWLKYDFPKEIFSLKKHKGQEQKWYLFYFLGDDKEINLNTSLKPEFSEWKWETITKTIMNVTNFKKKVYIAIFKEFAPLIKMNDNLI